MALTGESRGAAATLPQWRLVDRVIAAYGVVVALYSATRLHQTGVPLVMAAHLALPALAWLVAHAPPSRTMRVIRAIYPVLLLTALYSAIDVLNRFGAAPTWDAQIQAIDQAIFGMQPSRDWWRAHPSGFWSTVLHAAYLSYYFIITVPVFALLARARSGELDRYLDMVLSTYIVCYLFYLFMPVAGPYYEFARPTGAFVANLPARLVYAALAGGSAFGAAFPSSHVAATVAATIGGWSASRRLGLALAIPTALLAVAVVYCQMHYAFDAMTGVALGGAIAGMVGRLGRTKR